MGVGVTGRMYNYVTGQDDCDFIGNMPEPDCRFRDDAVQSGTYGSLMYRQYLNHVCTQPLIA